MIKDEDGYELLYWPVGAVRAGENGPAINIQVDCGPGKLLACSQDDNGTVFGGEVGGPYVDLALTPIDLTPFPTGYQTFTIYFHASSGVTSGVRVPLSVGVVGHSGAAW